MSTLTERIDIQVKSRHELDEQLEAAVRELQEAALHVRARGILITRRLPGRYTAELSDHVPFGMTRELLR
ncbi:hypothetical protein [Arthrobacter sp. 2MCAF14]|uniref:hypothetical protein n=1 Tax=Arthrobacter sp. 2MCAF14 TaxID=3232982 RepID=UPI003F93017E